MVDPCDTLLGPSSVKPILFALRALKVGVINITGIQFKLCGTVKGKIPTNLQNFLFPCIFIELREISINLVRTKNV